MFYHYIPLPMTILLSTPFKPRTGWISLDISSKHALKQKYDTLYIEDARRCADWRWTVLSGRTGKDLTETWLKLTASSRLELQVDYQSLYKTNRMSVSEFLCLFVCSLTPPKRRTLIS